MAWIPPALQDDEEPRKGRAQRLETKARPRGSEAEAGQVLSDTELRQTARLGSGPGAVMEEGTGWPTGVSHSKPTHCPLDQHWPQLTFSLSLASLATVEPWKDKSHQKSS